jgi:hypothetical protein
MRPLPVIAVVLCLLCGCPRPGPTGTSEAAKGKPGAPVILELLRLRRQVFSLREARLVLSARLVNPGAADVFVCKATVVVELNGERFDVPELAVARKLASGETVDVAMPVTIDFRRTGDSLYIAVARKLVDVRVSGEACVRIDAGERMDRLEAAARMPVEEGDLAGHGAGDAGTK